MPMQMGWRWYGEGNDPITLNDIKQIPGVSTDYFSCYDFFGNWLLGEFLLAVFDFGRYKQRACIGYAL